MKQKLLTDVELRARWSRERTDCLRVEEGTILTPAARDFLREQGVTLTFAPKGAAPAAMTTTAIPTRNGGAVYVDAATGESLDHKPEDMTHLRGNLLVPKTHPRIEFRGRLDSLMAQLLEVQLTAQEEGRPQAAEELEELLAYVRKILGAEVKDEPLEEIALLGMDSARLRWASHHVKETLGIDHPVPNYRMGRLCVALNRLRTQVREVELSAVRAFPAGERGDIVEGLNRLSSCVYILFCRNLSGWYDGGKRP